MASSFQRGSLLLFNITYRSNLLQTPNEIASIYRIVREENTNAD